MSHFTANNTEGFDSDELAAMNTALDAVAPQAQGANEQIRQSVGDALNNAWLTGMSAADLIAAVGPRFGVAS